jgi:hypothetical protein
MKKINAIYLQQYLYTPRMNFKYFENIKEEIFSAEKKPRKENYLS